MKKRDRANDTNKLTGNVASALLFGGAAFLALFALWAVAYVTVQNDYLVPSLRETFVSLGELLTDGAFYSSYAETLLRVCRAFAASFLPALVLAVFSYAFAAVRKVTAVFVSALRTLPAMALLLIILVWTSPKDAPVIVAFLSLFPLLYTGVLNALFSVDEKYKRVCAVYRVPFFRRLWQMYLPQSFPYILRESAGAAAFSVKLVVSAEVVSFTMKSVGGMMQDAKIYTDMPRLFALTLLAVFTGLILETAGNLISIAVERRVK